MGKIDNFVYLENKMIKMLDRSMNTQSDKNELFNKGLDLMYQ